MRYETTYKESQPWWLVYQTSDKLDALSFHESSLTYKEILGGKPKLGKCEWDILVNIGRVKQNGRMIYFTDLQKIVLNLFYWKGFTCPQIGKAMGITKKSVNDHRKAGLKKLRAYLFERSAGAT